MIERRQNSWAESNIYGKGNKEAEMKGEKSLGMWKGPDHPVDQEQ